ncbi:hypothetical protein ACTMUQ_42595 [Streptomyces sp. SD11]|uniref:hypothetical protein n=1 Tax=Streptomyces sp. SD11 TaxID=3452209 RepID=UPI003F89A694
MDAFGTAGHLAGVAGLAPVPRDSGRISSARLLPLRLGTVLSSDQWVARVRSLSQIIEARRWRPAR